ncbi:MAG: zinc metalloprotease HtpX [Candidatus Binatus sp.]|uniref:zinc metalloprotease HtpX n=1 Tax=Candidatus Binatus sp. TaxID=2811406 RepID=UPI002715A595|nr:zinc metalloprotease HtpX [Candidatus Binatus sp.]MDO8434000.1 zinc metalloprotease HtpX [Candidatus Binatus sp.]
MSSLFKTTLLLGAMTGLLMVIGGLLGGRGGLEIAFVLAAVMNFVSYWFSDKIVLRAYGAQELDAQSAPELYSVVNELAHSASIPMPRLYMIDSDTPNAFATGRNPHHAAVAVTRGIMRICDREELKGVIGHELSHVLNRDILTSSIAATLAGAIMMVGTMIRWGAFFGMGSREDDERGGIGGLLIAGILAPIAASLIQMAISRTREYQADASGAKLTHNPLYLASALRKLEAANERMPLDASPATAHLFIVNPLSAAGIARLFSTHPPIDERIHRLEQMASHGEA